MERAPGRVPTGSPKREGFVQRLIPRSSWSFIPPHREGAGGRCFPSPFPSQLTLTPLHQGCLSWKESPLRWVSSDSEWERQASTRPGTQQARDPRPLCLSHPGPTRLVHAAWGSKERSRGQLRLATGRGPTSPPGPAGRPLSLFHKLSFCARFI